MAVSVRMNPELEKELELAAQSKGITKSQFIIDTVEHALGRKDPYQLLLQVRAEMDQALQGEAMNEAHGATAASPYDTGRTRAALIAKLRAKHGLGPD